MEIKITSNLAIPIVVVLLIIGSIGGYAWGHAQGQKKATGVTLEDNNYEALASKAVTNVSAEVQGTVKSVDGNKINVEKEGDVFTLELPEGSEQISLSIRSILSEEDQKAWSDYKNELDKYNKAVSEYYAEVGDDLTTDSAVDLPQPPVAPFEVADSMLSEDGADVPQTKSETKTIVISDLKEGDTIQASLSAYLSSEHGTSTKKMQVLSVSAIRDLTQ